MPDIEGQPGVLEGKPYRIAEVKSSHTTLTGATSESLRSAIQAGSFPPGSQLPPEMELIAMLGVSRSTLREALRTLEEQGFIERRRGLGTFVRERSIVKDLSINFGISEMIAQAGMSAGSEQVAFREEKAASAVAAALELPEGAMVVVIDRVRTANGRPVVWTQDILPAAIVGSHPREAFDLEKQSVYQYLEESFQIRISRGVARLLPVNANAEAAARLNVKPGAALLCVSQTDYSNDNRPVLHSIEYHVPDAFVFMINRRGPHW